MRRLQDLGYWSVVAAAAAVLACGRTGGVDDPVSPTQPVVDARPDNPVVVGQEDFLSVEREGYGWNGGGPAPEAGAGSQAPSDGNTSSQDNKAPSGRTGEVEEADIYRVDNNRLFYLNTYRGFITYDLTDPQHPRQVSRLPVHGYPIEMFVTPTTVFALLRDALYVTQDANGLRFHRHNVSQLVAIDITDLAHPRVVKTIDIIGELKEGVSRKIDDTLYVVSHMPQSYYWPGYPYGQDRTEQAWVYSFNVADPANPILKGQLKIFEGGGGSSQDGNSYSGRWFSSVAISATANTLHVVENWYTYGWVSGSQYQCGSYRSMQEAVVSIIDISDPTGVIRLHSRFSTYGSLTDQFKHTYVHDPATGHGYYFGIFARQEWQSVDCSGTQFIQNNLEAWDVTDGANPVRVSSLPFGKPNETVRGTAFDTSRGVAYAITAQRIDPLYALDISDPTHLKVLSAVDGLSGDMNVFRLIGGGQFLIGIGRDNSETCTGYGDPTTGWWSTNVAVSVIDVQDLSAIRLVQRKCVTVQNASWVWSEINWNLDQAHKMIGMHTDSRASVISVPVNYYAKEQTDAAWWWYRPESAVGLMSFDLAAYDPTRDHLNQTVLQNHGTVVHDQGHVRRSVVFTHHGVTDRRMMVNLSDTHVSVVDIDDLDAPVKQSVVEVAPRHNRLYRFGNYVVDEVRQGDDYYSYYGSSGRSEFRVKAAAPGLDDAPAVATFSVTGVQQVVQFKNLLVLFRPAPDSANVPYYDRESEALVYDLSVPTTPVLASTVRVPAQAAGYPWYGCGDGWGYWPYAGTGAWAASGRGLGMLTTRYTQNSTQEQHLVFLDLANAATPSVTNRLLSKLTWDSNYRILGRQYLALIGNGNQLVATFKVRAGEVTQDGTVFAVYRYYAEPLASDLTAEVPTNVPGRLLRAWVKDGAWRFLTTDERFSKLQNDQYTTWVPETRLHLVGRNPGQKATLLDTLALDGLQLGELVGDADKLFMTLRRSYYYWYGTSTNPTEDDLADRLAIIDLRQDRLNRTFMAPVGTWYSQLMGVDQGRLFVNLPGDGVLAVDVTDLSAPRGQHFVRTLGYATHIVFSNHRAFIASGNFGIYEMDLSAPASVLQL